MNLENRGTIFHQGGIMYVNNGLVEEIFIQNNLSGYLLISYAAPGQNNMTFINLLRLNVNRNTVILNSFGQTICLCDMYKGMWVDAIFSPNMTRSIPPQSNAFLIVAKEEVNSSISVTTDRIAKIDRNNASIYTGNADDIYSQTRFIVSNNTPIRDTSGNPINLSALRPGQVVKIIHANFQTASIPPQTTAFYIQLL